MLGALLLVGEEVGAAVVPRPGEKVTAADLRDSLFITLAHFKVPRFIWIEEGPLPRNASGKVLKRELRFELDTSRAS